MSGAAYREDRTPVRIINIANRDNVEMRAARELESAEKKHNAEVGLNFILTGVIALIVGGLWVILSGEPRQNVVGLSILAVFSVAVLVLGLLKILL